MTPTDQFDSSSHTARSRRRRPSRRAAPREPRQGQDHATMLNDGGHGQEPRHACQEHREQTGQETHHAVNPHVSRTSWSVVTSGGPSRSSPSSPERANPRPRDRKLSRERNWGKIRLTLAAVDRRQNPLQPHRRPVTKAASGGRTPTVSQPPRWSIARRVIGLLGCLGNVVPRPRPKRGHGSRSRHFLGSREVWKMQ
jgi:hypothetical protein